MRVLYYWKLVGSSYGYLYLPNVKNIPIFKYLTFVDLEKMFVQHFSQFFLTIFPHRKGFLYERRHVPFWSWKWPGSCRRCQSSWYAAFPSTASCCWRTTSSWTPSTTTNSVTKVNEGLLSPFHSNIIISSTKAEYSLLISVDIFFPFRTVYSPFHISKGTWIVVLSFYYQNLKFKGQNQCHHIILTNIIYLFATFKKVPLRT